MMIQDRDLGDEAEYLQIRQALVYLAPACPQCGSFLPSPPRHSLTRDWHEVRCVASGCKQIVRARFVDEQR